MRNPSTKVVSDLFRRFSDHLESKSSRPVDLSPSPPINHVANLPRPSPGPHSTHRSNIGPQPSESGLRTSSRPPHSRYQTMVLPTSSSTTVETRSYFSIEIQPIRTSPYVYPYIHLPTLHVDQERTGLVCGRISTGSKGRAKELGYFRCSVCWYVIRGRLWKSVKLIIRMDHRLGSSMECRRSDHGYQVPHPTTTHYSRKDQHDCDSGLVPSCKSHLAVMFV